MHPLLGEPLIGDFEQGFPKVNFQAGLGTAGGVAAITAAPLALSAAGLLQCYSTTVM